MLHKLLETQGANHRRWRVALALLLAPFAVYAFTQSGWMTNRLGPITEEWWDIFCLAVALIGLTMRVHMAGYGQAAEAGELLPRGPLSTCGLYSIVRYPASIANFLIVLSGSLLFKSPFFTVLVVIVAGLYYERLMLLKERLLLERHGQEFTDWAAVTPLILPAISTWKNPETKFDWKAAIRREAVTFAFIGVMFFVLETMEGTMIDGLPFWEWVGDEPQWLCLFSVSAVVLWTQLSRVWAILALLMSSAAVGAAHVGEMIPERNSTASRALKALSAGGYVLLLRHATTDDNQDMEDVNVNDCSTQRNLSGNGRSQARALGGLLREKDIVVARTISSQYCRTRETARLLGMDFVETMPNLNEQRLHVTLMDRLFGNSGKDEHVLQPIRSVIADWKERGTLLLVSHAPIITGLTFNNLKMGEGLVLKPAPHLPQGFTVVGKFPEPYIAGR